MSKSTKSTTKTTATSSTTASTRRNPLQNRASQQRRGQRMLLLAGATTFIVLLGLVVYINIRNSQPIVGESKIEVQGSYHMDEGAQSPVAYNSTPPTSGAHYSNLLDWRIYNDPQRYESLVHNMEDGGVIVYYQCVDGCPETVKQLKEIVTPYVNAGKKVVMTPNDPTFTAGTSRSVHQAMQSRIVLTAWGRLIAMEELDGSKIRSFIDRYEGIDHHTG